MQDKWLLPMQALGDLSLTMQTLQNKRATQANDNAVIH